MSIGVSITREELLIAYVDEQRSMEEIGHDLCCSADTVSRLLMAFDIQIRSNSGVKRCRDRLTKEFLDIEYVQNNRSTTDIAKEIGCSYNTVNRALREHKICIRAQNDARTIDLTNKQFGHWKVLKRDDIIRKNTSVHAYLCECKCGRRKIVAAASLRMGNSRSCIDCATLALSKTIIPAAYIGSLKHSAFKRGIPFLVDAEYLEQLYEKQNRRCVLTGARLNMGDSNERMSSMTASVDRIDSSGVYEPGNVQWVHKMVNTMKWDLNQQDFIDICHSVAAMHPKNENTFILADGAIEKHQEVSDWVNLDWSKPRPNWITDSD